MVPYFLEAQFALKELEAN